MHLLELANLKLIAPYVDPSSTLLLKPQIPNKSTLSSRNYTFFIFISNFSFSRVFNTILRCLKGSSLLSLKIKISSRYTITNFPFYSFKTSFINLIKVLGALVSPNGITNHSYNPFLFLNAVFHSSPYLIII